MENEPLHILLADDDANDRLLFKEAFADLKIKTVVRTVNDGIQLMEWLHDETNHLPHLLFLDLNLPRKNGLECLKEIKDNEKLKDVSIAIYSTSDNEKDIDKTFRHGANVYITKPNNFDGLKQVLEKAVMSAHLHQNQSIKREHFLMRIG